MVPTRSSTPKFVLGLLLASGALAEGWGSWPDLTYAPDPSRNPGWSDAQLDEVRSALRGFHADVDGAYFLTDAEELRLHPGQQLVVYYQGGGRQGIAGNAEVVARSEAGEATLRVRLAFLMQWFAHHPWKGWGREVAWREGYEPSRMRYFVSRRNLATRPLEEFEAIRTASLARGMHAGDVLRTWGAPAARGKHVFSHGPAEQWVYQQDPFRRAYVYVDVGTRRLVGFHGGHVHASR